MSIAEKLTQIAENEKKVYDAGYAEGLKNGGGGTGDDDGSYQEGYDQGLEDGKAEGIEIGKAEGYEDGYDEGKADGVTEGYNNGYSEGKTDGRAEGYTDGRTEGYTEGKADGVAEGIETGYATGKADGITEGIATGKAEGIEIGRVEGYEQGEAAGKQEESEAFWNGFTDNGKRTSYSSAFNNWGNEYIRPTRKIIPKTAGSASSTFNKSVNLKKVEAEYFDFSQKPRGTNNSNGYYYTFFMSTKIEEIEDIGIQADFGFSNTFSDCYALHTIAMLRCDENTLFDAKVFQSCSQLKNIAFDGVIGQTVDIHWSPLTADSMRSIITHLSDAASGKTLTLSTTAKTNAFTDAEWATLIATKSNWTISLS
jgi:hypothetical protein